MTAELGARRWEGAVPEIDGEKGWAGQAEFVGGSPGQGQRGCAWEFEIVGCGSFFFWRGSEYDEVLIIGRLWVVGL